MKYWFIVLFVSAATYLKRSAFIIFLSNWEMPKWLTKSLRYVPVTIFPALVAPMFFLTDGQLDITIYNPKLISGLVAFVIAWRTKNLLLTLLLGMAVLWGGQWVLG